MSLVYRKEVLYYKQNTLFTSLRMDFFLSINQSKFKKIFYSKNVNCSEKQKQIYTDTVSFKKKEHWSIVQQKKYIACRHCLWLPENDSIAGLLMKFDIFLHIDNVKV